MQRALGLLAIALLVLLAAALFLLDFRFLRGELATESSAQTFAFSVEEESRLPLEQELALYVQAPPPLREELAGALEGTLVANPFFGDVALREAPLQPVEEAFLLVDVAEPQSLFWSPFYTATALTLDVAYASDGAVDWIDEDPVRLQSGDAADPVVRLRAEQAVSGAACGLISRPAYHAYVARELARQINTSLAQSLASYGPNA